MLTMTSVLILMCIPENWFLPKGKVTETNGKKLNDSVPLNDAVCCNNHRERKPFFFFNFKRFLILFFERQSASMGGAEREGETQNPKQAPGSQLSA